MTKMQTISQTTKQTLENKKMLAPGFSFIELVMAITIMAILVAGTVAVSDVVPTAVTVAFVAPKYTMLLAGVVLKLVPVIVTELPGFAIDVLSAVMVGGIKSGLFLRIARVLPSG